MIVEWSTSFTENFVFRSDQITKIFRSGHDCTSMSPARIPCHFRLQGDITIWVLRKLLADTMLARTRFHFCSRLHGKFMRRTGSVSMSRRRVSPWLWRTTFIDQIFSELLQPVRQFMQQIAPYFFVSFIFICVLGFGWFTLQVCPLLLNSYFHFFRLRHFPCICWCQIQNPLRK